ncbi:unnamed protein product [Paramecium sonneborni]|uniref:Uncharacterized protein n=1 Tax=Paramecium sonneborni TaxID=65129 RepID=A0A8S1JUN9_9CILI|nr:unnamed protein product [Paramecium sonneborni]
MLKNFDNKMRQNEQNHKESCYRRRWNMKEQIQTELGKYQIMDILINGDIPIQNVRNIKTYGLFRQYVIEYLITWASKGQKWAKILDKINNWALPLSNLVRGAANMNQDMRYVSNKIREMVKSELRLSKIIQILSRQQKCNNIRLPCQFKKRPYSVNLYIKKTNILINLKEQNDGKIILYQNENKFIFREINL